MGIPDRQYSLEYDPEFESLKSGDGLKIKQQKNIAVKDIALSVGNKAKRTIDEVEGVEPTAPLTEEETEAIQADIRVMLETIDRLRNKAVYLHSAIDQSMTGMESDQTTFFYNLTKRPRLKRALNSTFGQPLPFITYANYLRALEIKEQMEQEEAMAVFEREGFDG